MSFIKDNCNSETKYIPEYKTSLTKSENLKLNLCEVFLKLFPSKYSSKTSRKHQVVYEITINAIISCQIVALFWYDNMPITNWNTYSPFWEFFSYANVDNFCSEFGIFNICFITISSLLFFSGFLLFLIMLMKSLNKKMPKAFKRIFTRITSLVSTLFLLPTLNILLIIFKYSSTDQQEMREYKDMDENYLNYGSFWGYVSIFLLIYVILLAILYELCTCDMQHTRYHKNIKARSNSKLDLWNIFFMTILKILHVLFDSDYIAYYYSILLVFSIYLIIKTMKYLPYYDVVENSIIICKFSFISTVLFSFLLGYYMGDAGIITILSIFLTPLVMFIILKYLNNSHLKMNNRETYSSNQYSFEHTLRHILLDKGNENTVFVINKFSDCYEKQLNFKKNKLFAVWEINFCLKVIKDEGLARLKSVKLSHLESSLEGIFQESKIKHILRSKNSKINSEITYFEYLSGLENVKIEDEEICTCILDLWTEILGQSPNMEKVFNKVTRISLLADSIKKSYESLIAKNKFRGVFDLYVSFLDSVLCDSNYASQVYKKSLSIPTFKSGISMEKRLNDYDESVGIILISASNSSFGSISFINEKACSFLKITSLAAIGIDFSSFIPSPYSLLHNEKMKIFCVNCHSTILNKPSVLFLQNLDGTLIECSMQVKLTEFQNDAYFIVSFVPIYLERELILLSELGEVFGYSGRIPSILGVDHQVKGLFMSDLVVGLYVNLMPLFEIWKIEILNKKIGFIHGTKKIKSTTLHYLIVITDENCFNIWEKKESIEQLEYFNKLQIAKVQECTVDNLVANKASRIHIKFEKDVTEINELKFRSTNIPDLQMSENDEKSMSNKSKSSISLSLFKKHRNLHVELGNNFLNQTQNAIRILKWVLFFSVFFT